ncbi:MAG TPA: FeoC-like transcriptional regulator [Thermoanaerobaculaceae bacterium]|nr:FeoC-like transcriptional regulator [Thermoanaerobaculaceae bacterium]HRS14621.1 FeoC-like transcriptional regulator [Thermoanaerobaculaceae bacterium]
MLERLLAALAAGVTSVSELARTLDTSPALVETMLEDLARRGLVQAVEGCKGACSACGVAGCLSAWRGRAWTATPRPPTQPTEDRKPHVEGLPPE